LNYKSNKYNWNRGEQRARELRIYWRRSRKDNFAPLPVVSTLVTMDSEFTDITQRTWSTGGHHRQSKQTRVNSNPTLIKRMIITDTWSVATVTVAIVTGVPTLMTPRAFVVVVTVVMVTVTVTVDAWLRRSKSRLARYSDWCSCKVRWHSGL